MSVERWEAPPDVRETLLQIRDADHPHLAEATFAVEFVDSKPFVKDRLNLGKVSKFSGAAKLWHPKDKKYDFCISLCADVWQGIMKKDMQHRAWLDLRLCQCQVEYEPETIEENGKKKVVKDDWGRVSYTDVIRRDDAGRPVWKVVPADIKVISQNIKRYGLWYEDLEELTFVLKSDVLPADYSKDDYEVSLEDAGNEIF